MGLSGSDGSETTKLCCSRAWVRLSLTRREAKGPPPLAGPTHLRLGQRLHEHEVAVFDHSGRSCARGSEDTVSGRCWSRGRGRRRSGTRGPAGSRPPAAAFAWLLLSLGKRFAELLFELRRREAKLSGSKSAQSLVFGLERIDARAKPVNEKLLPEPRLAGVQTIAFATASFALLWVSRAHAL